MAFEQGGGAMILDFTGSNFKSFGYEYDFFMQPQSTLTELKYSILEESIHGETVKALSSSPAAGLISTVCLPASASSIIITIMQLFQPPSS